MGSPDRYAFIDELCRIPESDEERLRRGRFSGDPEPNDDDDENDVSVESTGIVMISLPETPEDGGIDEAALPRDADGEGEVFLTPREESSLASSRNSSGGAEEEGRREETEKAVDLGRDTDVWCYSEAELACGGVEPVPVEIRVLRIGDLGVPSNSGKISQSPSKRLKISDAEVDSGVARDNLGADTAAGRRKSIDDIDKFKYVGGGKDGGGARRARRALPGSICGWNDGQDQKNVEEEGGRSREGGSSGIARKEEVKEEITLLGVLKMLADAHGCDDDDEDDDGLEGLSVWDAAKRKGMTFP